MEEQRVELPLSTIQALEKLISATGGLANTVAKLNATMADMLKPAASVDHLATTFSLIPTVSSQRSALLPSSSPPPHDPSA